MMLDATGSTGAGSRTAGLDVTTFASIAGLRTMVFPFFGMDAARSAIKMLERAYYAGDSTWLAVGLGSLGIEFLVVAGLAAGGKIAKVARERWSLAGAAVTLIAISITGATGTDPE
ncbi:MAG: hypothetical protein ACI8TX_000032 [Hyphomicrobiaceae bacterium]|jgi:hypothetical protein